jgi:hypothetical protein
MSDADRVSTFAARGLVVRSVVRRVDESSDEGLEVRCEDRDLMVPLLSMCTTVGLPGELQSRAIMSWPADGQSAMYTPMSG